MNRWEAVLFLPGSGETPPCLLKLWMNAGTVATVGTRCRASVTCPVRRAGARPAVTKSSRAQAGAGPRGSAALPRGGRHAPRRQPQGKKCLLPPGMLYRRRLMHGQITMEFPVAPAGERVTPGAPVRRVAGTRLQH